jgi:hypothetical protein
MADDQQITLTPWYASHSDWAIILTALVTVLAQFHVQFSSDLVNSIANFLTDAGIIAGFVVSWYLHRKAKKTIINQANATITTLKGN